MERSREEKLRVAESLKGTPFLCLPGNPPPHKVVGNASDGTPIRAEAVQMVFNDAWLMDKIEGTPGGYIAQYRAYALKANPALRPRYLFQIEVYELAMKLYAGMEPIPPQGRAA